MARIAGSNSNSTKQLILKEALTLFEENGYIESSMRMVQKRTQLSKGTLYYHFNHKEELFIACIEKVYDENLILWKEIEKEQKNAVDKLYAWARLGIKEMRSPIIKSLLEFAKNAESPKMKIEKLLQIELDILSSLLKEGVEQGEFKSDLDIKDTAVIMLHLLTLADDALFYGYLTMDRKKDIVLESFRLLLDGIQI